MAPISLIFISLFLNVAVYKQLQEYEQKIFGSIDPGNPVLPVFAPTGVPPSFSFGFPKVNDLVSVPAFSNVGTSIFARPPLDIALNEFTFGAGQTQNTNDNILNPNGSDIQMDGS